MDSMFRFQMASSASKSPAPSPTRGSGDGASVDIDGETIVVGAFGARAATLEAVGDWRDIGRDEFESLTPAGLFGALTSRSPFLTKLPTLRYLGHVHVGGDKQTMTHAVTAVIMSKRPATVSATKQSE